jgi:hypothetical protein
MFKYNDLLYPTLEAVTLAVMEDHPELLDDSISDFVDSHVEEL